MSVERYVWMRLLRALRHGIGRMIVGVWHRRMAGGIGKNGWTKRNGKIMSKTLKEAMTSMGDEHYWLYAENPRLGKFYVNNAGWWRALLDYAEYGEESGDEDDGTAAAALLLEDIVIAGEIADLFAMRLLHQEKRYGDKRSMIRDLAKWLLKCDGFTRRKQL